MKDSPYCKKREKPENKGKLRVTLPDTDHKSNKTSKDEDKTSGSSQEDDDEEDAREDTRVTRYFDSRRLKFREANVKTTRTRGPHRSQKREKEVRHRQRYTCTNRRKSSNTPLLDCSIKQRSNLKDTYGFKEFNELSLSCLPDTGTTKTIIALDVVKKHKLIMRKTSNIVLTDASENMMNVEGTVRLSIRPKKVNGRSNKSGKFIDLDCLVSSCLTEEMFLSWGDLIRLGVIPSSFPEVWTEETNTSRKTNTRSDVLIDVMEEYTDVLHDDLSDGWKMKGRDMHITLKNGDIKPCHVTNARKPPLALKKAAKTLLRDLEKTGVIEKVTEPSVWVSPGHFVPKPNGGVRLVTDYTELNKHVRWPERGFPSSYEIREDMKSDSEWFCVLDATSVYFQVKMDSELAELTTFSKIAGDGAIRYRYLHAPMGLASSGDEFNSRTDEALLRCPGTSKLVDDVLIQARTEHELADRVKMVLERGREHGITFSKKKLQ